MPQWACSHWTSSDQMCPQFMLRLHWMQCTLFPGSTADTEMRVGCLQAWQSAIVLNGSSAQYIPKWCFAVRRNIWAFLSHLLECILINSSCCGFSTHAFIREATSSLEAMMLPRSFSMSCRGGQKSMKCFATAYQGQLAWQYCGLWGEACCLLDTWRSIISFVRCAHSTAL